MRRSEFLEVREEVVQEILDRGRYGHLAVIEEGRPRSVPLNFARVDGFLYLHGSPAGLLGRCQGQAVGFSVVDMAAWIPSTWRHPHNACPATTFYRSTEVQARLERVLDLEEKALSLEAFMVKYQPQAGHQPIEAGHPRYRGALSELEVARLPWSGAVAKRKVGQHLSSQKRLEIGQKLEARGYSGDRWVALEIKRLEGMESDWIDDPRRIPRESLQVLLGDKRPSWELEVDLQESFLTLARLEEGQVQAFARVLRVGEGKVLVTDLAVLWPALKSELWRQLLAHPALAGKKVFLAVEADGLSGSATCPSARTFREAEVSR